MEQWKDIEGYEGLYEVSNEGNVKSLERFMKNSSGGFSKLRERILKPAVDSHGYLHVNLCKGGKSKVVRVHRLVAEAFIANIYNKDQVNHIDGNKQNNRLDNLEWCDKRENQIHAYKMGLQVPRRKL